MGQSTSKKSKKKTKDDITRNASSKQPSKNLNNRNAASQKAALNDTSIVKNEIRNERNSDDSKPNNTNNTKEVLTIVNTDNTTNTKSTKDGGTNLGVVTKTEITKADLSNAETALSKERGENAANTFDKDLEMRNKVDSISLSGKFISKSEVPEITCPVSDLPDSAKIVRSASTGGEFRRPPMRKLSNRESTEFRRRQFYQQILSNQSQFDTDHIMNARYSVDSLPSINRGKIRSPTKFYSYTEDIREYKLEDYPMELRGFAENLEKVEKDIKELSKSEIDLYFATMKDDLHNQWRKVFSVSLTDNEAKAKKVELINRIKIDIDVLNNRYLGRKLLFVKY